jgi:hypothetical protein
MRMFGKSKRTFWPHKGITKSLSNMDMNKYELFWAIVKICIIMIKTKANILVVSLKEERNQGSLIMH